MKRHIKDMRVYPFNERYRCGLSYQLGDNYFTPILSDSTKFIKGMNVCLNCWMNWLGRKNYFKRKGIENAGNRDKV